MISFDKAIVFDIDGTICPLKKKGELYEDMIPYTEMIVKIREYKALGYRIIFATSRNMGTYQGNLGEINAVTLPKIVDWLRKWDIPFDEIYMGKPWACGGFYVDDKAVRPNEFLNLRHDTLLSLTGQDE